MRKIILAITLIILTSCSDSTQEQNNSKKPEFKGKKVLILGNSIVKHFPLPQLGWYGNWGMAASSESTDFVHNLTDKIHLSYGSSSIVRSSNVFVEAFEDPLQYEYLQDKYDYIIIKLGENVDVNNPMPYKSRLVNMINYFKSHNTRVIILGTVWYNPIIDTVNQSVCESNGYKYVSLSGMQNNYYYALDDFTDISVGSHPNDAGMEFIAQRALYGINNWDILP